MPFQRKFYPAQWDRDREEALQQVGYCCELCGVRECTVLHNVRRASADYPEGRPYMVYLSRAHKHQYQTWMVDAETMVLCQRCHRAFDRQFRRKAVKERQPLGVALLWVWHQGEKVLAADASWVHDLLDIVLSLPAGTEFELCLEVMTWRVGSGRYRKERGGVTVMCEEGACQEVSVLLASGS